MKLPEKDIIDDTFAFVRDTIHQLIQIENDLLHKYQEDVHYKDIHVQQLRRNTNSKSGYFSPYESKNTDDLETAKQELADLKEKIVLSKNSIDSFQSKLDTINAIELYCDESFYKNEVITILEDEDFEEEEDSKNNVVVEKEKSIDDESMAIRLKNILSYMEVDTKRAKMELKKVIDGLK